MMAEAPHKTDQASPLAGGSDAAKRRQRMRSTAIALALAALVVLFYVATIVRLGPNALRKGAVEDLNPAGMQLADAAAKVPRTATRHVPEWRAPA